MYFDKRLMNIYKKHIFLFNPKLKYLLETNILKIIKTNYKKLFADESLVIKKFLSILEEEMHGLSDMNNTLSNESANSKNSISSISSIISNNNNNNKNVLLFIAKTLNQHLISKQHDELHLYESNIGDEGTFIVNYILKKNYNIGYVDFSYSKFEESNLRSILNVVELIDDFFTINLEGIDMSLKLLKLIKHMKAECNKLEVIVGENKLSNKSKASSMNGKRNGKNKKHKFIKFNNEVI